LSITQPRIVLIVLKFDTLVQYGFPEVRDCKNPLPVIYTTALELDIGYLNRNNSAADCSISLEFGTMFDHD